MISRIRKIDVASACCFGVLTMDLNGLKKVNDNFGHMAGDNLIRNAAEMLEEKFGRDELYRVGGDEFIVIFPNMSETDFEERMKNFREVELPASGISMSVGTVWSRDNSDTEKIFFQADQNMYADKKAFYSKAGAS